VSTTVKMVKAVIHVVAIHATQKLAINVTCDSAVLVVNVIATVE
jgi:hypothetical protein